MPRTRPHLFVFAIVASVVSGGCAGDDAALPQGRPDEVVARAPERTLAAGVVEVAAAAPTSTAEGTADLRTGEIDLEFEPDDADRRLEMRDPVAVVDLVRGAINVESYGGAEVRGVSTLRFDIDIDVAKAAAATPPDRRSPIAAIAADLGRGTIFADLYVDRFNRIRRVTIPVDYADTRPHGRERRTVAVITVDFVRFASDRS